MEQKTYEELVEENQKLKKQNINLKQENTELKIKVENQELHINLLNKYVFGAKREATPKEENIVEGTQCSMFGVPENEEIKNQVEEKTEEIIVHIKKKNKKVESGIKYKCQYINE